MGCWKDVRCCNTRCNNDPWTRASAESSIVSQHRHSGKLDTSESFLAKVRKIPQECRQLIRPVFSGGFVAFINPGKAGTLKKSVTGQFATCNPISIYKSNLRSQKRELNPNSTKFSILPPLFRISGLRLSNPTSNLAPKYSK
jgi:hypothetical protein